MAPAVAATAAVGPLLAALAAGGGGVVCVTRLGGAPAPVRGVGAGAARAPPAKAVPTAAE